MGADGRMIVGELDDLARPYVRCRLALPGMGIADRITFLVDTGADATYLHPSDGLEIGFPFDLLQGSVTSSGIGGSATYFPEPAVLTFTDSVTRQHYGYRISVNMPSLAMSVTGSRRCWDGTSFGAGRWTTTRRTASWNSRSVTPTSS